MSSSKAELIGVQGIILKKIIGPTIVLFTPRHWKKRKEIWGDGPLFGNGFLSQVIRVGLRLQGDTRR